MCCLLLFCWPFNGNTTKLKRSLICSNYFSFLEFSNNITCKKHRCHSSLLLVLVFSGLHLGVNGLWLKVNTEWPVLRTSPQKWRLFFFFFSSWWLVVCSLWQTRHSSVLLMPPTSLEVVPSTMVGSIIVFYSPCLPFVHSHLSLKQNVEEQWKFQNGFETHLIEGEKKYIKDLK